MMGAVLAAGARVPLAGRGCQDHVVRRHIQPPRLMKVLTKVLGLRVILFMYFHNKWPMVRSPDDIDTGSHRTEGEASATSE